MKAIYGIINKINGKKYVGSAVNFYKRKTVHLSQLRGNKHHSRHLQSAWNKHGEDKFEFVILEKVEQKEQLIEREQWWLDNSTTEYNISKTAGSPLGIKRTAETREKCRKAHLGKTLSDEHKANIGKTCDADMMREKQQLSVIVRKRNKKPLSAERREDISRNNSESFIAIGENVCHIFSSLKEASQFVGKSKVTLWRVIKKGVKYKDYLWKKKKDYVPSSP